MYVVVTSPITSSAEFASSILDKIVIFILASVAESVETRITEIQPFVTRCESAELASYFYSSLISLIADGTHHYHPACGH